MASKEACSFVQRHRCGRCAVVLGFGGKGKRTATVFWADFKAALAKTTATTTADVRTAGEVRALEQGR